MGKFFMKVYRHKSQKQVNKETTFDMECHQVL